MDSAFRQLDCRQRSASGSSMRVGPASKEKASVDSRTAEGNTYDLPRIVTGAEIQKWPVWIGGKEERRAPCA